MDLVEHLSDSLLVLIPQRPDVELFIVDKDLGFLGLCYQHLLNKRNCRFPFAVLAEAHDLVAQLSEGLQVRLGDLQILFQDLLRVLAVLFCEVFGKVEKLHIRNFVIALSYLEGLDSILELLCSWNGSCCVVRHLFLQSLITLQLLKISLKFINR